MKFLKWKLSIKGVDDPVMQWGQFLFVRHWDEDAFLDSLKRAERTPREKLSPDGHRAILFSSATDPYQDIRHPDDQLAATLNGQLRLMVRRALELILERSTLNVRILTRSPDAREDFDLFKKFGSRLIFGMSLPTLCDDLAKVWEPNAPAPMQRFATLYAAKEAGLNIFVAVSPTYPESDDQDLRQTLKAIRELQPLTIFHEPMNIGAKDTAIIKAHAAALGLDLEMDVFNSDKAWENYAINTLRLVHQLSLELGVEHRLHLWPDSALGSDAVIKRMKKSRMYRQWIHHWWNRISEWPQ